MWMECERKEGDGGMKTKRIKWVQCEEEMEDPNKGHPRGIVRGNRLSLTLSYHLIGVGNIVLECTRYTRETAQAALGYGGPAPVSQVGLLAVIRPPGRLTLGRSWRGHKSSYKLHPDTACLCVYCKRHSLPNNFSPSLVPLSQSGKKEVYGNTGSV